MSTLNCSFFLINSYSTDRIVIVHPLPVVETLLSRHSAVTKKSPLPILSNTNYMHVKSTKTIYYVEKHA